jgi:hypothetical protein
LNRVLFPPAAAAELDEAYRWYERQRAGLGDESFRPRRLSSPVWRRIPLRFLWCIATSVERCSGDSRTSLIYRVVEVDVFVLACFHGKRNPRSWRSRR